MSIDKKNSERIKKEDETMMVNAKPKASLPVIDIGRSKDFIKKSNKKKLSDSFLRTCKESSSLFKKDF